MSIEHVVWDWNGTLLDDVDVAYQVMNGILEARSKPLLTRESYTAAFRFPVEVYYREIGLTEEPFPVLAEAFISAYIQANVGCDLQPGVVGALETVRDSGRTQSVLSAAHQDVLVRDARRCGVDGFMGELVGLSDHHARSKVEEGRAWLSRSGLDPASVVMVGDTDHDAEVAEAIGLHCVLVSHGHQDAARLSATGKPVLSSMADLLAWLGH